jgi:peptidoglycan hydrolase-like protein with peptidoglycan-binding domain
LEQYLAVFENENLPIDGIYSQDDANAVIRWQEKYRSEILTPWGASRGTGYIFITSLRKFRELFEMQCKPDEYVVPETPSYFYRDLKLGMKGDDVRKLQEILITKSTG